MRAGQEGIVLNALGRETNGGGSHEGDESEGCRAEGTHRPSPSVLAEGVAGGKGAIGVGDQFNSNCFSYEIRQY